MTRARVVVLTDPIHPYAVRFLEAAARRGLGTVCLWTSRDSRAGAHRYPALTAEAVVAHHWVDLDEAGLQRAAQLLRTTYDVAAVVPHVEPLVAPSVTLAHLLGLSWAQPQVMSLFRDKHALKQALSRVPGGPRTNRIALVASLEEVRAAMTELDLDRVVIKPNDGFGNVSIGFFDRSTPDAEIAAHLARQGRPMLLEERLEGQEYFANGQVDAAGHVDVTRVGTYVRTTLNGRPNVEVAARAVRTHEPEFALVEAYARHVVRASGVRRTPFHLECIVDADGPCLVEAAARLVGGDSSVDSWLHGVDLVDAALAQYLDDGAAEPLRLDWQRYDAQVLGLVQGISDRVGRIVRVRGLGRAEALPGFHKWHQRPTVGDKVVPTVDLFGNPWSALVTAPDLDTWVERGDLLRSTVELDLAGWGVRHPMLTLRSMAPAVVRAGRRGWVRAAVR